MKGEDNVPSLCSKNSHTTVTPQISVCWDTEVRMMTTGEEVEAGGWCQENGTVKWRGRWGGGNSGGEGRHHQWKDGSEETVLPTLFNNVSKKGERWGHFTCRRMKVFIVAKMRATLQKQHRDTTVTQPGPTSASDQNLLMSTSSELISSVLTLWDKLATIQMSSSQIKDSLFKWLLSFLLSQRFFFSLDECLKMIIYMLKALLIKCDLFYFHSMPLIWFPWLKK